MKATRSVLLLSPLFTTALFAGCASAPAKTTALAKLADRQPIHVEGVMTDNGMGCTALRTADGSLYTFAHDLEGSKKGERVWIDGYVTAGRGCQVGTYLMPERAGLVNDQVARTTVAASNIR